MLGHAGGAATLDAPTWLLAYGAAACVLLATVLLRSRIPAPAPDAAPEAPAVAAPEGRRPAAAWARKAGRAAGRVAGPALLATTVVAAFVGPDSEVVNFAPAAVLAVWWIGLPLAALLLAGDVMAWLDPFGPAAWLAGRVPGGRRADDRPADDRQADGPRWTAPVLLAAVAWWVLAYQGADSPRGLGGALLAYTGLVAAGAWRWGPGWVRRGEAFGALSAGLATLGGRFRWRLRPGPSTAGETRPPLGLVAVWLGASVFDVFAGSGAWVDLAGASSGWARTGLATAVLAVAVAAAGALVGGAAKMAAQAAGDGGDGGDGRDGRDAERATVAAMLAATAGAFLAHGVTLLLVDGQRTLAHASDPFGRGWDLFGTADRLTDYTPLTPTVVGVGQLALAVGANLVAVAAAWSRLGGAARAGRLRPAAAARTLWTVGLVVAILATATVAVLATDLE